MEQLSAHCSALTMEHLLSPCTRYRDMAESQFRRFRFGGNPERLRELNLNVSTEELLSIKRAFTYADLYAMLGNDETVVWLTPHAVVMRCMRPVVMRCMRPNGLAQLCVPTLYFAYRFSINADGKEIFIATSSSAARSEILAIVGRLLAVNTSEVYELDLINCSRRDQVFNIAPTCFEYLMRQCQRLKVLSLTDIKMDEDQIRALGAVSRPDLEMKLVGCLLSGASAEALAEVLKRNQGPTEISNCDIDNLIIADALRGNSHLKTLRTFTISRSNEAGNREFFAITSALRENKGLVYLGIRPDLTMSDESWDAGCDCLKTLAHPTLQVLDLAIVQSNGVAPAVLNYRIALLIQALVDMLKVNTSIHTMPWNAHPYPKSNHTISWNPHYSGELFRRAVAPYLETNRCRPRLLAIQKTRPILYRVKVLGRALLATRTDPHLLWMLLIGNAEIAFPSTANLPSPATAIATSNAAGLPAAINSVPDSAADVATPAAGCLKRKLRPY
jgi:hypothetical protein